MLLNENIGAEVKALSALCGKSFTKVSAETGIKSCNISVSMRNCGINDNFVKICESLGYDVRIEFVKRENE